MSTGARDCLPPRVRVIWVSGRVAISQRQRGVQTKVLSMASDWKGYRDSAKGLATFDLLSVQSSRRLRSRMESRTIVCRWSPSIYHEPVSRTSARLFRVPKGGSLEPWSPEIFCRGARSPIILLTGALILFWLWSPEPKDILRGARSPAFSSLIIRVPRLHWFLITAFLCLFVWIICHNLFRDLMKTLL